MTTIPFMSKMTSVNYNLLHQSNIAITIPWYKLFRSKGLKEHMLCNLDK